MDITYAVGQGLDRDALKKIAAAQKEIKEIDRQMAAKAAAEVPGAEGALEESFRNFLDMASAFLLG